MARTTHPILFGPMPYRLPPSFAACRYGGGDATTRYKKRLSAWNVTGGYCWHCREPINWFTSSADGRTIFPFERDHLIPKSRGGRDEPANIVPACQSCNASKCNSTVWTPETQRIRHGKRRAAVA